MTKKSSLKVYPFNLNDVLLQLDSIRVYMTGPKWIKYLLVR